MSNPGMDPLPPAQRKPEMDGAYPLQQMDVKRVITLIGPPGAGKGTQTKKLVKAFDLSHIATGDILRDEARRDTALGRIARQCMDRGQLVPDEVVEALVEERIRAGGQPGGFILDGFPRTLNQAQFLSRITGDRTVHAINFKVDEELVLKRLSGRRSCPKCGKIYNVYFSPSQQEGICDACGTRLIQRVDDHEDVISKRLRVYREQTRPLIQFYGSEGNYFEIDADRDMEAVFEELSSIVQSIRV